MEMGPGVEGRNLLVEGRTEPNALGLLGLWINSNLPPSSPQRHLTSARWPGSPAGQSTKATEGMGESRNIQFKVVHTAHLKANCAQTYRWNIDSAASPVVSPRRYLTSLTCRCRGCAPLHSWQQPRAARSTS
eukprot:1884502-Pleurochrysis_carterae.AAC.2